MKLLIVFFMLIFVSYVNGQPVPSSGFSYGHGQSVSSIRISYGQGQSVLSKDQSSSTNKEPKEELTQLRNQLIQYVDTLMSVLMSENIPRKNQIEILEELKTIADINGKITIALNQISQGGLNRYVGTAPNTNDIKDENISFWVKNQVELIRKKHLHFIELYKMEQSLDNEFYINLALDGVVILVGSVLFFIPAVGPAISIPLTVGRIALTGQKLGVILMTTGVFSAGVNSQGYFFGEEGEQGVISFIVDVVAKDLVTKTFFTILSSSNPSDTYLANSLLQSPDLNSFIATLLGSIKNDQFSVETRQASIEALVAFKDEDKIKEKSIEILKEVIESSQVSSLRETSASVLGEIGEGEIEVWEYLKKKGKDKEESDKFRLIALIQLGRNKTTFPQAIESLVDLLIKNENQKIKPLNTELEIPDFFRNSLLSVKKEELQKEELEKYVIVLTEFIRSGILDIELKLRFSETLIEWNGIEDSKDFLVDIYSKTNPVTEFNLYVDKLSDKTLSEANTQAFEFLKTELSELFLKIKLNKLKNKNSKIVLEIEKIIDLFENKYSKQDEIAKKIKAFLNSYKKILEIIKK